MEKGLSGVERSALDPQALCSSLPSPNPRCWCPYLLGGGPGGFACDFLLPFPGPDLSRQLQDHRVHHLPEEPTQMSNMGLAPNTARRTCDFPTPCPAYISPLCTALPAPSSPSPKPLVTLDSSLSKTSLPAPKQVWLTSSRRPQSSFPCPYYVFLLRPWRTFQLCHRLPPRPS